MLVRAFASTIASAILLIVSASSSAALISVDSGFSELPTGFTEATFGGSGIPNAPMSWSLFDTSGDQSGDLLIALGASQRFASPALTNDGSGTFFATTGDTVCFAPPGSCTTDGPRWNFNFFIESKNGPLSSVLSNLTLSYELDPNSSETATLGLFNPQSVETLAQNSWNLGFEFLNTGLFGGFPVGTVPAGESFDRDVAGTYDFVLTATSQDSVGSVSMSVTTASDVPAPATLALLGLGLVGLRLRRK